MVITCASDIMKKYTALIERGLAYIVPKDPITAPVAIHHALEHRGAVHLAGGPDQAINKRCRIALQNLQWGGISGRFTAHQQQCARMYTHVHVHVHVHVYNRDPLKAGPRSSLWSESVSVMPEDCGTGGCGVYAWQCLLSPRRLSLPFLRAVYLSYSLPKSHTLRSSRHARVLSRANSCPGRYRGRTLQEPLARRRRRELISRVDSVARRGRVIVAPCVGQTGL